MGFFNLRLCRLFFFLLSCTRALTAPAQYVVVPEGFAEGGYPRNIKVSELNKIPPSTLELHPPHKWKIIRPNIDFSDPVTRTVLDRGSELAKYIDANVVQQLTLKDTPLLETMKRPVLFDTHLSDGTPTFQMATSYAYPFTPTNQQALKTAKCVGGNSMPGNDGTQLADKDDFTDEEYVSFKCDYGNGISFSPIQWPPMNDHCFDARINSIIIQCPLPCKTTDSASDIKQCTETSLRNLVLRRAENSWPFRIGRHAPEDVTLQQPNPLPEKVKLGACTLGYKPIPGARGLGSGSGNPEQQIHEWFAWAKLFHIEHVVFYSEQVLPSSHDYWRKVLKPYIDRGYVTFVEWPYFSSDREVPQWARGKASGATKQREGQFLSLNDCLYRAKGKFEWLWYGDVDEFPHPNNPDADLRKVLDNAKDEYIMTGALLWGRDNARMKYPSLMGSFDIRQEYPQEEMRKMFYRVREQGMTMDPHAWYRGTARNTNNQREVDQSLPFFRLPTEVFHHHMRIYDNGWPYKALEYYPTIAKREQYFMKPFAECLRPLAEQNGEQEPNRADYLCIREAQKTFLQNHDRLFKVVITRQAKNATEDVRMIR